MDKIYHNPVLVKEVLQYLDLQSGETFVDCTFGFGGHAKAILEKTGGEVKVIGIEKDREVFEKSSENFANKPVTLVNDSFEKIKTILENQGIKGADGVLLDLGVSSYHFDSAERGFSFLRDEPLDMHLDQTKGQTAADIINGASKEELAEMFYTLADETYSRQIAKAIYAARQREKITRTAPLVEIIASVKPSHGKTNPATQVFQALRITVNDELNSLSSGLQAAIEVLNKGGRIAVISFHSGEDRIVKNIFKQMAEEGRIEILTKKPVSPNYEQIKENPRARSARLRAAIKN